MGHLPRVLEPEVMDTETEALDYDAMDHGDVNARFCDDLFAFADARGVTGPSRILDVGSGTALIPIELCRRAPTVNVDGIDLAEHMLAVGRRNVERAGLDARITLHKRDAKRTGFADGSFGGIVSNSIVHHIPEPRDVFAEMWRVLAPGGVLFVRDLFRPESDALALALVDTYAARTAHDDPAVAAMHERQRALFDASLRAALTVEEVRALVAPLGVAPAAVQATSDRHWTLACTKP
jgi:ubiquinone/menaquinone biosynthesis C-methylase UbiE